MSCPWAKIEKPKPVNLEEIISEEVARDLQAKEEKKFKQYQEICALHEQFETVLETPVNFPSDILRGVSENNSNNDKDIDQEAHLKDDYVSDSEEEEIEDISIGKQWNTLDTLKYEFASLPSFHKVQKDGKIVTTYTTNGRRKNSKLSSSPKLQLRDRKKFDLKLSNELFSSLKVQPKHEEAERYKFLDNEQDHILTEFGLDMFTRFILYKMINNQLLERINDVINIGKEAVILHADLDQSFHLDHNFPKECVIKIFRMTNLEIKQMEAYIKDKCKSKDRVGTESLKKAINKLTNKEKMLTWDWRLKKPAQYLQRDNTHVYNSVDKLATRKTVRNLAENEMNVLIRLQKAEVPCPKFIKLKTHVLVMSFIGENNVAAPSLREANMTSAEYIIAYNQVIEGMKTMFEKANVIHTELLDNILWHQGQCYFIDFSQCVEPKDQHSFQQLFNDCTNVTEFFAKKDVPNVQSDHDLFKDITGFDFRNKLEISDVEESWKHKRHHTDKPEIE